MDAVLCFCYIDSQAGMSFEYLCFAVFDTNELDSASYAKLISEKIRLFYRYGSVQDYEMKGYTDDVAFFSERCAMIDEGYHRNGDVSSTRSIKEIDHLRYITHPDWGGVSAQPQTDDP